MKSLLAIAATALLVISCGDKDGGGESSGSKPVAAVQIAPINNSECTTGTPVSETQTSVTFEWNPSANTESYFLYVKNLLNQSVTQYNAGDAVTYNVNLLKGVPYSWYVSSRKEGATSVSSATWKFYNAGDAVANYAPFPAEAVSPGMSATISGTSVDLEWEGGDIDNDIANYKVYLDTNPNPTTLKSTVTQPNLNAVAVNAATTYFWAIVTTDAAGNSSTSPVFQFKTN